jgi:hypothetical protein
VNAFTTECGKLDKKTMIQNALKVTSLNRKTARALPGPIMEFDPTMPTDGQRVPDGTRFHPKTCQLTTSFTSGR